MENEIEMQLIPAGEFNMGSPFEEVGRYTDEGPQHRVTISKPFYMGIFPVTQGQWQEVMGNNPSHFKGDNLPVESVSCDDVQEFIKKLNEKEGTAKYRLPSEAEWEYACRAGTTTRYSFGDDDSKLREYTWYSENSGGNTHPVGKKKANPWGLYDMQGNVCEWVQDKGHDTYNGAPTDGSAWEYGNSANRVIRGGSCFYDARYCRSAYRDFVDPGYRNRDLGFRLVQDVEKKKPHKNKQAERKPIRIKTEKVIRPCTGSKQRKILSISGMLTKDELPELYLSGANAVYWDSDIQYLVFVKNRGNDGWFPNLAIGGTYQEEDFQQSLQEIRRCGKLLHGVNKELKRLNSQWQGTETFEI